MYLKHKASGDLVEVADVTVLIDPCQASLAGRFHAGEEMQEAQSFNKQDLVFPSDEPLPRCWIDPDYRTPH